MSVNRSEGESVSTGAPLCIYTEGGSHGGDSEPLEYRLQYKNGHRHRKYRTDGIPVSSVGCTIDVSIVAHTGVMYHHLPQPALLLLSK